MILLYHGPLPYEQSWQQALFKAYSRRIVLVYVDGDPSPFTLNRTGESYLTKVIADLPQTSGLLRVTLPSLLPLGRFASIGRTNRWLAMRVLLRALGDKTNQKIVLVAQKPGLLPTLRGLPASLRVYEVVDDYVGLAALEGDRHSVKNISRYHQRMLRESDVVWATSDTLVHDIRDVRDDVVETSNGVDCELFASGRTECPPPVFSTITQPRVGLVGNLNDRIDWHLIEYLCRKRPALQVVLVGPVYGAGPQTLHRLTCLEQFPNLHHLPGVVEAQLPAYISALDVCLIPYRLIQATLRINPLKLYQYLAAGKPVVSTALPALRGFRDVVSVADTAELFVVAIDQALARSTETPVQRRRQARAWAFDWQVIADQRLEVLRQKLSDQKRDLIPRRVV